MRSAIHDVFGEPQDVLHMKDAPVPQPGKGQLRIRTLLSPIHNHDIWTVRGSYGYKPPLPGAIGGSEAVGIVDALGEGVDAELLGKRVTAAGVHGTWAEYFLAPASGVVPVPDAISDEAAAQLIAMPFSAISLLEFLSVKVGDWIIQNTANGAVGKAVAMLAKARGVHVINIVRRDAGVEELASLGIDNGVSTADENWKDKVRELTKGASIRAGVDSIGGSASNDIAELLGEDGLLVSFGTMTGEPMQISSGTVIFKHLTIKGFWGSRVIGSMSADDRRRLIGELLTYVANETIILPVEGIYELADISDAVTASLSSGKAGKVLLKP
ncbi:zinc-binding dehydrogenase [Agrobacterium sp. rho-13.3]|jgi:NADPH:quinone reductase-like Zn-dependent oxidoreductase|uniref:zinc-binding dehydrogenase n=1 Tax=Agrobacterium sp. rho-13.3 TaxID=3072980 RepID=UPI002A11D593|nr:zinc-binding dehydrogenase [Agrobacterium sp. rho-13.3]MDX8309476.1 zinc-binding dehydrogenase [Agrobacterium sp. rho-13.3]